MARYVNYDRLLKERHRLGLDEMSNIIKVNALNHFIDKLPTADMVEVRHGRWIINDEDYWTKCSVCEFEYLDEQEDIYNTYRYCPHCGAKMVEGVTE